VRVCDNRSVVAWRHCGYWGSNFRELTFPACLSFLPTSGGFRGGRAGFAPPHPLGDGLTSSLTVPLICDNSTALWRHHRQFISSQNMVLRIFKMIFTSGFLTALECTKFDFGRASARTPLRELTALPQAPLDGLRGPTSKGEWRQKGEGRRRGEEKKGGKKRDRSPYANFWIRPCPPFPSVLYIRSSWCN